MKKQFDIKKLVLLNLPYLLMGLFATNFGEAWRLAQGANASEKFLSLFAVLPGALQSFWPSLHPLDLLVGLCCGAGLRLAVYLKSKNAKKYRHGMEYGSARWGTREDIAPYIDPVFQNNVILTKTESLTMNSRPKDPKTARNKNVLVIGGSGSGKTRFWLKPNLMQMHSSYVVTDPKGTILVECGKMLQRGAPKLGKDGKPMKDKHGKVIYEPYRIKVLNTINFKKSMHYNPFAYFHICFYCRPCRSLNDPCCEILEIARCYSLFDSRYLRWTVFLRLPGHRRAWLHQHGSGGSHDLGFPSCSWLYRVCDR